MEQSDLFEWDKENEPKDPETTWYVDEPPESTQVELSEWGTS